MVLCFLISRLILSLSFLCSSVSEALFALMHVIPSTHFGPRKINAKIEDVGLNED